jgi:hypothetical protein
LSFCSISRTLGFVFDVWAGTGVAIVCCSAKSAVLRTRSLELARHKRALLFACGTDISGVLVSGGDE